jgi:D-arginine dehydrogenase
MKIVVIGAGIAGASIAAELAESESVNLVEMESQPGYHTTGRSAALYAPSYGPEAVRVLTKASLRFFCQLNPTFWLNQVLLPRGAMFIAARGQEASLEKLYADIGVTPDVALISREEALKRCPLLRGDYVSEAMLDVGAMDMDVSALHQGYLKRFKSANGSFWPNARVEKIQRKGSGWSVSTANQEFFADVVVNAAGAWASHIGKLVDASPIPLTPKRRTAMTIDSPPGIDSQSFPAVINCEEDFYLRPDAGRLLISPADETPSVACDAQPEEMDVALTVERIQAAFELKVSKIRSKWAGLRTFAADKQPVCGFDDGVEGFFWFAGQGGYGIQMAPALAQVGSALIRQGALPSAIVDMGFNPDQVSPKRFAA